MSFYKEVESGNVRATMVLGVPRSASSVLSRALATSPDINAHIFQPFYENENEDDLDRKLVEATAKGYAPSPERPLHILMKIMAESLSGQRFSHVARHTERVVVMLRDPQSQFLSTCRAVWQLPSGKRTYEEELASFKRVQLKDHKRILDGYIVIPWQRMENHVAQLQKMAAQGGLAWCIMDGDALRAAPDRGLKALCQHFDMHYTPAMVHSWSKSDEKTVGLQEERYKKSWLGRVQHTTSIQKPVLMTPRLEDLSSSVRPQIEANLRTYIRLLASNHHGRPGQKELKSMIAQGFAQTSPIACYSLAALMADDVARAAMLAQIREAMPAYDSSYDIIDRTVHRLRQKGEIDTEENQAGSLKPRSFAKITAHNSRATSPTR